MFELSQLRCFVAVAEELHFGRAADRLNMTQPPLSRQIQLLEHIMGVQLLERSSRSVRLTAAGSTFLAEASRILRLSESAMSAAQRVAIGDSGTIEVGFTAASCYEILPRVLASARQHLPNVEFVLREMVSGDQIDALLARRIDIGLLRPPIIRSEFATRRLAVEPLIAAVQADDRLARAETIPIEQFDGHDLIMYSPEGSRYFYDLLCGLFSGANIVPVYTQYVTQIHSMLALISAGLGAALVPRSARALRLANVAYVPVATTPPEPVELYLAWRKDSSNPALSALLKVIETSWQVPG